MANSRLSKRFKLYDWQKFSKDFKKKYKEENDKPLTINTALFITYSKVTRPSLFDDKKSQFKEPEVEDVLTLIKLGNNNCNDEEACEILENYLEDENVTGGLTGAFLDLMVDFYSNLKISKELTDKAIELKQLYLEGINKSKDNEEEKESESNETL